MHGTKKRSRAASLRFMGLFFAGSTAMLGGGCPPSDGVLAPVVAGDQTANDVAPVAQSATILVPHDKAVRVALPATGFGGETLVFSIIAPPGTGNLSSLESTPAGGFVTYTPPTGFAGTTSFRFTAADSVGVSASAEVQIDVLPPVYFTATPEDAICPFDVQLRAFVPDGYTLPDVQYCWGLNEQLECVSLSSHGAVDRIRTIAGTTVVTLGLMLPSGSASVAALHSPTGEPSATLSCTPPPGSSGSEGQSNAAPIARAGADQALVDSDGNGLGPVTLDASASSDADGTIVSYRWTEAGVELANVAKATLNLAIGTHTLVLTVTDNDGATGSDEVVVSVGAQGRVSATPSTGMICIGPVGGPFTPNTQQFTLTNTGAEAIQWSASSSQAWVQLNPSAGELAPGASSALSTSLGTGTASLGAGNHSATISITNTTNGAGSTVRTVLLTAMAPNQFAITGTVTDSGGEGISGVTLGGLPGNPQTNADGQYSAVVTSGFSGTVTPAKVGHTFFPTSRTYNNITNNRLADNYLAYTASFVVSGHIRDAGGNGISGVTMSGLPGDPQTNASGFYTAAVSYGWSGTVTPAKSGYEFGPANRVFNAVTQDQSSQQFFGQAIEYATSISRRGVTWTFNQPYRVGSFVNGDRWVVGPVQVVSVSPGPTGSGTSRRNGSMRNPVNSVPDGYDGRSPGYTESLSVSFPATLQPDQSLVSAVSRPENDGLRPDLRGVMVPLSKTPLISVEVLSVLSAAPQYPAFRPPYAGTQKPLFNADNLRMDLLPSLAPLGPIQPSDVTHCARMFERAWIMHSWAGPDAGQYIRALDNLPHYYRDAHLEESGAAMVLVCDPNAYIFSQTSKRTLTVNFVQYGIDAHYVMKSHTNYVRRADRCLSKLPGMVAGLLLDNAEMRAAQHGYTFFKTDVCTYFGTSWSQAGLKDVPSTVLFRVDPRHENETAAAYNYEHRNPFQGEWCTLAPDGYTWWRQDVYRRTSHSYTWIGTALAAELMGLRSYWNHEPFFRYSERWMTESESGYIDALNALSATSPCGDGQGFVYDYIHTYLPKPGAENLFLKQMWQAYKP